VGAKMEYMDLQFAFPINDFSVDELNLKRDIEDISTTTLINGRKVINIDVSKVSLEEGWKIVAYCKNKIKE
jgi:hypothetical protein